MKTVIILGGTSHIAKGLISRFLKQTDCRIEWFGRSAERMAAFLNSERLSGNIALHGGDEDFFSVRGDTDGASFHMRLIRFFTRAFLPFSGFLWYTGLLPHRGEPSNTIGGTYEQERHCRDQTAF